MEHISTWSITIHWHFGCALEVPVLFGGNKWAEQYRPMPEGWPSLDGPRWSSWRQTSTHRDFSMGTRFWTCCTSMAKAIAAEWWMVTTLQYLHLTPQGAALRIHVWHLYLLSPIMTIDVITMPINTINPTGTNSTCEMLKTYNALYKHTHILHIKSSIGWYMSSCVIIISICHQTY